MTDLFRMITGPLLPTIIKQSVNGRCYEVYVDGGITQGTDMPKTLILGARMMPPIF